MNTQSVWGSISNCTISGGGAGIATASHLTGYNLSFAQALDTSRVDLAVADVAPATVNA